MINIIAIAKLIIDSHILFDHHRFRLGKIKKKKKGKKYYGFSNPIILRILIATLRL